MNKILIAIIILMSAVIYKLQSRNDILIENVQTIFESLHECDSSYTELKQKYALQHNRVRK